MKAESIIALQISYGSKAHRFLYFQILPSFVLQNACFQPFVFNQFPASFFSGFVSDFPRDPRQSCLARKILVREITHKRQLADKMSNFSSIARENDCRMLNI